MRNSGSIFVYEKDVILEKRREDMLFNLRCWDNQLIIWGIIKLNFCFIVNIKFLIDQKNVKIDSVIVLEESIDEYLYYFRFGKDIEVNVDILREKVLGKKIFLYVKFIINKMKM